MQRNGRYDDLYAEIFYNYFQLFVDYKQGAGGREGEGCTNADVWLMTHSYTLSAIEETSVERCSPFA